LKAVNCKRYVQLIFWQKLIGPFELFDFTPGVIYYTQFLMLYDPSDVIYEGDVCRKPGNIENWYSYIKHLEGRAAPKLDIWMIYERSLLVHPLDMKLWKVYLEDRVQVLTSSTAKALFPQLQDEKIQIGITNNVFERALEYFPFELKLYLDFVHFLLAQRMIFLAIEILDIALQQIPILQHHLIWQLYLKLADNLTDSSPSLRHWIWKRVLKLEPTIHNYTRFVQVCIDAELFDEAAHTLEILAQKDPNNSEEHLWHLSNLVVECPPAKLPEFPMEGFLRKMLDQFPLRRGQIWCTLGTFFIRIGDLERAELLFEEALAKVEGPKDFAQVFEGYAKLEETILVMLTDQSPDEKDGESTEDAEKDISQDMDEESKEFLQKTIGNIKSLIDRRPLLLTEARLRQHPNNVNFWLKKAEIIGKINPDGLEAVFEEAINRIKKNTPHKIFLEFAKYKKSRQLNFSALLEEAIKSCGRETEFWIGWSQLLDTFDSRLNILRWGAKRNMKNRELWVYYLDFVEAAFYKGQSTSKESVVEIYETMIDSKIVGPDHFVNYADFIQTTHAETMQLDDRIFQIYHRGIQHLGYPAAYELWNILLPKAVSQWGEKKLERVRELFEEALIGCPAQYLHSIYLLYGDAEERFGLGRSAIKIYQRAALAGADGDRKVELFKFAINKAKKLQGLIACRPVFEEAISPRAGLLDHQIRPLIVEFAGLEVSLGEFDRARTLFGYGGQFADPARETEFWGLWRDFETKHGNEETFREMLRVKRAVQAKFDQNPYFVRASKTANVISVESENPPDSIDQ
jgi:pre-mRNA-splicing factor SYF1